MRAATAGPAPGSLGVPWQRAVRPCERAPEPDPPNGADPPDGVDPERAEGGAEPEWHRRFRAAWEPPAPAAPVQPDDPDLPDDLGLLEVARPLVADACRTLRECLHADLGPDAPPGLDGLLVRRPPLGWLAMAVQPSLTRELAAASRAGRLPGATPEERYASFVRSLRDPATALAIWRERPVLARQVVETLDDWVAARLAFARELAADLPALAEAFGGEDGLGPLADVEFGAAETHRGGRSVALVRFANATVVHKPRSLAIDACFDRLLAWFNEASDGGRPAYALRRPRILDRGDRGWSEYVAPAPCAGDGLHAYFWRMGALLALTHAVHGYDLHADNVIASGADPVVVDLEALFHTERTQPVVRSERLGDPAAERLAGSVLRTGLLPGPMVMPDVETERPFGVDISPLGTVPDRRSLIPTPIAEDPGTDRMRIRAGYRTVPAPAGRLRLPDGSAADPRPHRDALVGGYSYAHGRLAAAGAALLAPGGPLHGCGDAPVRLIQLSTFLYVRLLLESWSPDAVRDAAERERGLDRLAAGWPGVPHRAELIAAEKRALWRGEVPVFEIRPGHRDVWLDDGTRLPGVLAVPPLDETATRLAALSPSGLTDQIAVIDAALAALPDPGPVLRPAPGAAGKGAVLRPDHALREALAIGRRLADSAVRSGDRVGWTTLEVVDARTRRVAPAGLDLYGGLPGIGLFLSALAAATGERWAADLAERVADEVVRRIRATRYPLPALGAVYHLAHAARLHGRPGLAEAARDALLAPPSTPPVANVLEGHAGVVLSALALHAVLRDARILGVARAAAEHLLAPDPAPSPAPDVTEPGFGYGASGIAVALARLNDAAPDDRYARRARALVRHEAAPAAGTGWCQGAAGVALARLELRRTAAFAAPPSAARDPERAPAPDLDLERSAELARGGPPPPDDSLCHGTFARLEVPGTDPRPPEGPWRTALPAPAPGLLGGISGVGYGLLRRARPAGVPSVLALAPPEGRT
ncbi:MULTISPECIES: type 2 lanthipeptide synthetase LanM family protein [Actinomadura]|uniref:Type 2 lanthipeptide synthetase LanM family protein n=1 Tax=Actinomadura yumaensis TaxID=111807 RepID=A0ABW2CPV0_9ACTN|nr:type 2 lanthipeptide synthetase LanM family protein [Actinomadura sp. J1-007]MWK32783.1 type 2 lantipeptide synthetase LanM [Actinomadura sp. J1-007]